MRHVCWKWKLPLLIEPELRVWEGATFTVLFFFFLTTQSWRTGKILIGEDNVQEVMIGFDLKLVAVSLWPWWCTDSEALAAHLIVY